MITPKQAYEAIQVLWPSVVVIKKTGDIGWTAYRKGNMCHAQGWEQPIDWGDTEQYPLPEPEWVDAKWPDDWNGEAKFSDDGKNWVDDIIYGFFPGGDFRWWSGQYAYKFCQVRKVKT